MRVLFYVFRWCLVLYAICGDLVLYIWYVGAMSYKWSPFIPINEQIQILVMVKIAEILVYNFKVACL